MPFKNMMKNILWFSECGPESHHERCIVHCAWHWWPQRGGKYERSGGAGKHNGVTENHMKQTTNEADAREADIIKADVDLLKNILDNK